MIDLERDCAACDNPTKRVSGRVFDAEFPGSVTPLYSCDNKFCRRIQNQLDAKWMRERGYWAQATR